ncbi:MAG: hypothetical protein LIO90_00135 [Bacteroidales bacterium]|nr:hypothetical protein [Bacteroidales bacterium]
MKLNYLTFLKIFVFVIMEVLWSCDSTDAPKNVEEEEDNPLVEIVLSRSEQEWVESNVTFSNKLLTALVQEKEENFLVSPYALANNLIIIANGSEGNGKQEIIDALYPGGEDLEEINLLYERLLTSLPSLDKKCDLKIFTCHLRSHPVMAEYTEDFFRVLESFKVDTFPLFENEDKMIEKASQWSEQRIGYSFDFEDLQSYNFYGLLTNALSFEGKWRKSFDSDNTKKATFYGRTKTVSTQMMYDSKKLGRFWEDDEFTWAMWPYGNEAFSFIVAMPNNYTTVAPSLDEKWLKESQEGETVASLTMPKFTIEGNIELMDALQSMGIKDIFGNATAKLYGMYKNLKDSDIGIGIGPIVQDYFLEVNEGGTKVSLTSTSTETWVISPLLPIKEVVIDHPFYFFIREQSTGLILFMGKIENL